jgi:opacity protein-like surface antigen
MIKRDIITLAALGLALATSSAAAQERLAVELRGGADIPTQEISGEELGTGFGFDATLRYRFMPHLAAYAGWDWIRFSPDASFAGADMDIEETGYVFGLRFEHPITGDSGLAGWIRGGGTYDHLELENADGDIIADSGHGLGWEAAAGLAIPVTPRLSVTPGVRYRALDRDVEIGAATTEVELRYIAVELGFALGF